MKKLLSILLSVILCTSFAACGNSGTATAPEESASAQESAGAGQASEEEPAEAEASGAVRVAAIFGGAINDGNWNETQYNGLLRLKEAGAETSFMENISDTDAAEAARTYAEEGYDLVFLATNSMQDYCTTVAESYPGTKFIQINGTVITENFYSVNVADEQQGFLQGAIAALLSESGSVGFVGGLEITPIILGSDGFQQGVDYVNETYGVSVTAQRINTGSFTDVNQAKETAISLIEAGCDVIAPMADDASVGIMEAAEEKGAMAIASGMTLISSAPTRTQVVVVKDNSLIYDNVYARYIGGELNPAEVETYGIDEGVVYLSEWVAEDVSDEVKTRVDEIMQKLQAGEITITAAA